MTYIKQIEDIRAWQKGRELVNGVYDVSEDGALSKDFGLKNQIRRASISIISNIGEGFERDGNRKFIQFLSHAKGSCGEVRSQLYILKDRGYIDEIQFDNLYQLTIIISRMLSGLIDYLRTSGKKGRKFL